MRLIVFIFCWLISLVATKLLGLSVLFKILLWAGCLYLGAITVGVIVVVLTSLGLLIYKIFKR